MTTLEIVNKKFKYIFQISLSMYQIIWNILYKHWLENLRK